MPQVWFYHLESTSVEQALPDLLEKVVQKGWRAYVHGHEDDKIAALNDHLWSYRAESFLAHGREGDELDAHQPVLLGTSGAMNNGCQVYMSVSPVDLPDFSAPSCSMVQRCLVLFDGNDPGHLDWARAQWKRLKSGDSDLAYWKQTQQGRWEKMQ